MNSGRIRADWPAPPGIIAGTTLRNSEFELPADPQWLNQVHGIDVVRARSADFAAGAPDADAIVACRGGDICVVKTADCLPVLLCSRDGQEIAAAHAGWRGLAAGVLEATIAAMSSDPIELIAWLGPAISQPAFEVGGEVRNPLSKSVARSVMPFLLMMSMRRDASSRTRAVAGRQTCTLWRDNDCTPPA